MTGAGVSCEVHRRTFLADSGLTYFTIVSFRVCMISYRMPEVMFIVITLCMSYQGRRPW